MVNKSYAVIVNGLRDVSERWET